MDSYTKTMLILILAVILFVLVLLLLINNVRLSKKKKAGYRANYPSSYICLDGHQVRSLSEVMIDNYFYRNGVNHQYEDVIIKKVTSDEKQYKYDWYLPDIDLYVEFFGFSGKKYKENTEAKKKFYRKNNLKMIALTPEDLSNLPDQLREKFGSLWVEIITPHHCPNCGAELDDRV